MKNIYFILIILTLFSCSKHANKPDCQTEIQDLKEEIHRLDSINKILQNELDVNRSENIVKEDFRKFFTKFMVDSLFQTDRIKFPLQYITWKEFPGEDIDTISINKANWEYDSFYFNTANERTQIYDNFELRFQQTNERLLHWYGVETGGDAKYFFKGFEGKWFLIKKEQLGD